YLYKSNGTSVTPLLDFFRVPANLTNANATLVFSVERFDNNGLEPWQSDGTNTTLIGDVNPGMNSSFPGPFAFVGGKLVFAADDGTHGRELYASLLQVPTAVTVAGFNARR